MTACANAREQRLPDSFYFCGAPEEYPENPSLEDLIYALNDTYLAWEECHDMLGRLSYK